MIDRVYRIEELDKPRESPWGTTTREQKEGLELTIKDYEEINTHCLGRIEWFASAWDTGSLRIMMNLFDMPFIKIPSALITYKPLLEACGEWDLSPIILSTGMSTPKMIDEAIDILGKHRIYCIMHCTSTYPTAPEEINARCILALRKRYPWAKIGFSNHYPGLMAMALAVAFGAEMIECHIIPDRSMYGSDQAASIEPQGIFRLIEYVKLIGQMKGDGIKRIYNSEQPIIAKLRRI